MQKVIPQSAIESYVLEIISRIRSIKQNCNSLLSYDYPLEASVNLAKAICKIGDYLSQALITIHEETQWHDEQDIQVTLKLLRYTDVIVQKIGSHIQFIYASKTENLPWSSIPAFQRKIQSLFPSGQPEILLIPQWDYNFSVFMLDLRLYYIDCLSELKDYVCMDIENEVLSDLKYPFYLITFPLIEKKNIRLHCLLGHEIGHLFAEKFITQDLKDEYANNIRDDIEKIVDVELKKDSFEDNDLVGLVFKKQRMSAYIELAVTYWVRALEELLSDIIGTILFGPAIIFSSFEIAIQQDFDFKPSQKNNFYPPWRMRLREIIRFLEKSEKQFFPIGRDYLPDSERTERLNNLYNNIKQLVSKNNDIELISKDKIANIAYRNIQDYINKAVNYFLNDCNLKDHLITPDILYKNISILIERLDHGIPPNAIESTLNDIKPATIVEIINAAWLHKISWNEPVFDKGKFNEAIYINRNRMNNLTLKAIEYSDIDNREDEAINF